MDEYRPHYALQKLVAFLCNIELDRRKKRNNFIHRNLSIILRSHIFSIRNDYFEDMRLERNMW